MRLRRNTLAHSPGNDVHRACAHRDILHERLLDEVVELEYWEQQRDDDEHDNGAHEHYHERAQQVGHGREQAVHFTFLVRSGAFEHLFELAAAFTAADEMDHHGRK